MRKLIERNAMSAWMLAAVAVLMLFMTSSGCDDNTALKYYMWGSGDLNIECLQVDTEPGTYEETLSISMSCSEAQSASYVVYTLDGTDPIVGTESAPSDTERGTTNEITTSNIAGEIKGSSMVFNPADPVGIELGETVTIKAMAVVQNPWKKDVYHKSTVQEFTYTTILREWKEVVHGITDTTINNMNFHVAESGDLFVGYESMNKAKVNKLSGGNLTTASYTATSTSMFAMCVDENENVSIARRLSNSTDIYFHELSGGSFSMEDTANKLVIANNDSSDFNLYCKNNKKVFNFYLPTDSKYGTVTYEAGAWGSPNLSDANIYNIVSYNNSTSNNIATYTDEAFNTNVFYVQNSMGLRADEIAIDGTPESTPIINNISDTNVMMPNIFTANNKTYTAHIDLNDYSVVTGVYDGSHYSELNALTLPAGMKAGFISLHGDESGVPYLAVKYSSDPVSATAYTVAVYKYINNAWSMVGSPISEQSNQTDKFDKFKLYIRTINGFPVPYVAFRDTTPKLKIFKFE